MKKRIVTVLLCICCSAMLLAGCGSSSNVTLSQSDYKGIEVEEVVPDEVTEEDVEDEIQSVLEENATTEEITDRAVKDGDIANIDYVGKVDGKEFDGGSADAYDLEIGSGTFIDGFEEQIIGHKIGEEFDINVTFPEDYGSEDLNGKEAVFSITLNSISKSNVPKLTDEFVKTVSETSTTVDEYKKEIREQLESDYQADAESTFADNVTQAVLDKAKVSEYDEDELEQLKQESRDWYEQFISVYYGMTMEDYLEQAGETEEDFDKEIEDECKETLKMQMVFDYIAEQEDLQITDEEFDEKIQEMVEENGYEDANALLEDYASSYATDDSEDSESEETDEESADESAAEVSDEAKEKAKEELRKSFLQEKVSNWLVENAKKVEVTSDDDSAETEEKEEESEE